MAHGLRTWTVGVCSAAVAFLLVFLFGAARDGLVGRRSVSLLLLAAIATVILASAGGIAILAFRRIEEPESESGSGSGSAA